MVNELQGTGVALVTPFDDKGEIDFPALEQLLTHTAKSVDYWVVMGTTGESVTLSKEEKNSVLTFVKAHNPKKLPIVYGIGGNHTKAVLEDIQEAELKGVTALLSVSPAYNKPSQMGITAHFQAVADTSPIPVILYNVPGRTGSNMTWQTTVGLAKHPNIIGIKEASGDLSQCMRIASYKPDDFMLISGDDILTPSITAIGGVGLISVLANAFPQVSHMTRSALKNDYASANSYVSPLLGLNPLMYEEGNPVGIKQVLKEFGICGAQVRLPLLPASERLQERINNYLREHQLSAR